MKDQRAFAAQTLIITLAFNAVLLAAVFLVAGGAFLTIVIGAVLTLALWFAIRLVGGRFIQDVAPAVAAKPEAPAVAPKREASEASALQLLSILQRKGRLIDFLQEDLKRYDDAQIGAAVRTIHAGCKQALAEYVELAPIYQQEEGSEVTIAPGFDAHAVRLVGNVVGDPPFKGALRHRGWRVVRVDLPERVQAQEQILAAAEVEVKA